MVGEGVDCREEEEAGGEQGGKAGEQLECEEEDGSDGEEMGRKAWMWGAG